MECEEGPEVRDSERWEGASDGLACFAPALRFVLVTRDSTTSDCAAELAVSLIGDT